MSIHEKLKIQTYLAIMIAVAASLHVFIGIYFAYLGLFLIVALSAADIVMYIVAFFINRAGKTRIASFIVVLKIMLFSVMMTYLLGTDVNAHWFVLVAVLPAALYLDLTKAQKVCLIASMPILINLQLTFPFIFTPPFSMYGNLFLELFFANIVVLGFIIGVMVNAIITRKIAEIQAKEISDFKHISNIDPLTELNNRRHAEQFFMKLDTGSQDVPSLFCLIDIDNFKFVNDTYGHDAGDAVLSSVANILRRNTRQTDLVCRWGGEEFLIVLPKCDLEIGRGILEKIRKAIESETIHVGHSNDIKVTVTCGASILVDNDIKETLGICDRNLYEGKRSGKNKIII